MRLVLTIAILMGLGFQDTGAQQLPNWENRLREKLQPIGHEPSGVVKLFQRGDCIDVVQTDQPTNSSFLQMSKLGYLSSSQASSDTAYLFEALKRAWFSLRPEVFSLLDSAYRYCPKGSKIRDDIMLANAQAFIMASVSEPNPLPISSGAALDSARTWAELLSAQNDDVSFTVPLRNSNTLQLDCSHWGFQRTDEAGLFFEFMYEGNRNINTLKADYLRFLQMYPNSAMADQVKAEYFRMACEREIYSPFEAVAGAIALLDSISPALSRDLLTNLGNYFTERYWNLQAVDSMAADLSRRFSKSDYLREVSAIAQYPEFPDITAPRKWKSSEILVSIGPGATGSDSASTLKALMLWQGALVGFNKVFKLVTSGASSDISVQFFEGGGNSVCYAVGGYSTLTNAYVYINKSGQRDSLQIARVVVHELGHALGLGGHSLKRGDIMFLSANTGAYADTILSSRDRNTIRLLYSSPTLAVDPKSYQVTNGQPTVFRLTVNGPAGLSNVDSVFVNLKPLGGPPRYPIQNLGIGIYEVTWTVRTDTLPYTILRERLSFAAKDKNGLSSMESAGLAVDPPFPPIPAAPFLVSPPNNAKGVPKDVALVWNPVSAASSYMIYGARDSLFVTGFYNWGNDVGSTSLHLPGGYAAGTKQYWKVRASNATGFGPFSDTWNFTTVNDPPRAPTLAAPTDSAQNIQLNSTLNWWSLQEAILYHLQLSATANFGSTLIIDDSTLTATSRATGSLSTGSTYYWRVRAKNDGGWGPFSLARQFNTIRTTSIERLPGLPTEFSLSQNYPNPFNPSTAIQFGLPGSSNVVLKIFDLLGRHVATLVSEQLSAGYFSVIWVANVPSGTYVYRIQAGDIVESKKMVLLR